MKVLNAILGLVFSAGFFLQAAMADDSPMSTNCVKTGCLACWKIGANHVDTKMTCKLDAKKKFDCSGAAGACPKGYNQPHCAEAKRCFCNNPVLKNCPDFGPCAFGVTFDASSKSNICKPF